MTVKVATKAKKVPGSSELKNPKWELFCWLYAGYHNANLFGNGTQCYMQAYGLNARIDALELRKADVIEEHEEGYTTVVAQIDAEMRGIKNGARTGGSDNLAKPNIRARIDYLVDSYITNDHSDRELQYVIMQRKDLNSKVAAIREFNRLKDRGGKGKLEGEVTFSWEEESAPKKGTAPVKKTVTGKVVLQDKGGVEWEA